MFGLQKSKNVDYKVEHPVFSKDKEGNPIIFYIDQFPEPKNMKQGIFLQKLSDALEESKNKIVFALPPGSSILSNNYFWLHGRKAFKKDMNLNRELLRVEDYFVKCIIFTTLKPLFSIVFIEKTTKEEFMHILSFTLLIVSYRNRWS